LCAVISIFAAGQLLYRMIAAVMAELQLVGLAAERQADQLMAEADAEDRYSAHHLRMLSCA
jgi:hypothetical protein